MLACHMMEEVFVNVGHYNFIGYEDGVDNATEENSRERLLPNLNGAVVDGSKSMQAVKLCCKQHPAVFNRGCLLMQVTCIFAAKWLYVSRYKFLSIVL